jgi:hypothetical protein
MDYNDRNPIGHRDLAAPNRGPGPRRDRRLLQPDMRGVRVIIVVAMTKVKSCAMLGAVPV